MSTKFSGASIDERGKISGGKAGDQTGREILTRDAYNHSKGWLIYRHPDKEIAKAIAKNAKAIADNDNFGYDQNQRTTGYNEIKKKGWKPETVTTKCELDCSELVRAALACALKKDVTDFNTASEPKVLESLGLKQVKSWTLDTLQPGDIAVTKVKGHTEVVTSGAETENEDTYYPKYTGKSNAIVDALKAVGEKDTSIEHRKKIGTANGISGVGSSSANAAMLKLLKSGQLKRA
ncbi:MAG: hypothetical protein ACI4EE_14375 [Lachnospiraceae bacterium]